MQHTEALKRLRNFFRRDETTSVDVFCGPTLVEQEPDLAREVGPNNLAMSAWAAGGHPID